MRTILITLFLTGVAAATFCGPAKGAVSPPCKNVYCATLPNAQERMQLLVYLANRKGAAVAVSPVVCATVSGSHRTGCAVLQGMVADARRTAAYSTLAKDWDGDTRAAFARLLVAEEAFARAAGANETDQTSADAGADSIAAQQAEKDAFLETLKKVTGGRAMSLVDAGRIDFSSADVALNAAYGQVMAVHETSNLAWGSVETAGIQRTQRAWLAYRDAFVAFAATIDADTADALKTELTRRRLVSLEGFLED